MAQKYSYFSPILDKKIFDNLMFHFKTKTWNEHPIASKAYKKAPIIFYINFCQ